jgi:dTDP-4-dehydrorhamnose reductase
VKVLIAGGTGLLGSHLARVLSASSHEVVRHGFSATADVRADLTDAAAARALIAETLPDAIVNAAALTSVDRCESDPRACYLLNVRVTENLLGAVQSLAPRAVFVHIGTDHVYDGPGPHSEDDVCPVNHYAYAKLCADLVAVREGATVLRTNFIGPGSVGQRASFADWVLERGRAATATTLFTDVWFTPLTIGTLCAMIGRVLAAPVPGIFNLGSRDGMSKRDCALAIARACSVPTASFLDGTIDQVPLTARRPRDMRMDATHFEQAFACRLPPLEVEIETLRRQR